MLAFIEPRGHSIVIFTKERRLCTQRLASKTAIEEKFKVSDQLVGYDRVNLLHIQGLVVVHLMNIIHQRYYCLYYMYIWAEHTVCFASHHWEYMKGCEGFLSVFLPGCLLNLFDLTCGFLPDGSIWADVDGSPLDSRFITFLVFFVLNYNYRLGEEGVQFIVGNPYSVSKYGEVFLGL